MPTARQATTDTVLESVRSLVRASDDRLQARRTASLMRQVAAQKSANASEGLRTDVEDNWALLIAAIDRGDL